MSYGRGLWQEQADEQRLCLCLCALIYDLDLNNLRWRRRRVKNAMRVQWDAAEGMRLYEPLGHSSQPAAKSKQDYYCNIELAGLASLVICVFA